MDNMTFHSWTLQKTHDELMKLGHTELASQLRNQCHGLHWVTTGGQIADINAILARAKAAIDSGRRGSPHPLGTPPDGTLTPGQKPYQSPAWDVITEERKVA